MTTISSGSSLTLEFSFFDENKQPVTPESLTYTLSDPTDPEIKTDTITSSDSKYLLELTVDDNTITEDTIRRKLILKWAYNNGTKGDVILFFYQIKSV